jgi:sarcosine oxidase
VVSWEAVTDTGVRVRTASGTVHARRLVLAAGAWMASDLPGRHLPLTVARQVLFWLRPAGDPARFAPAELPIWLWETREGPVWYGFPDLGNGPKVARHHGGATTTADTVDRVVSKEEHAPLMAFLATAIPTLRGPVIETQVCLYTNTPDEHFLLDRHPDCASVLIASPCSGHGFKFAPTIGEILADLATGQAPGFDLAPFALSRFAEA